MNQQLRKTIFLIMLFFLLALSFNTYSESFAWDCPECGRTGNTGNYCGGCGHPAPWIKTTPDSSTPTPIPTPIDTPIKETPIPSINLPAITTETSEDLIKIHVSWDGGVYPYHVYLYPYINEDHEYSGEHDEYIDQKWALKPEKKEISFDKYLTPDQSYWIKIMDGADQEQWTKYTFPKIQFDKFKVKIDYVFFETRTYGNTGYTGRTISKNKLAITNKNEEKDISTLIRLTGAYSDLFPEGYFDYDAPWGFTLIHPDGELTIGHIDNSRYIKINQKYAEWDLNAIPNRVLLGYLKNYYEGWLNIPEGEYTLILTYGNYYVGEHKIMFTK